MRLFSLMVALSLTISSVNAKNVKAHKHSRFDQPQAIALKLFGSKDDEQSTAKTEKKPGQEAENRAATKEDKKAADKQQKQAAKEDKKADKKEKAAAKVEAKAKDGEKTSVKASPKPAERVVETEAAKAAEKPIEQVPEKAADKPIEQAADKAIEQTADKPVEKPAKAPIEKAADKPLQQAVEAAPPAVPIKLKPPVPVAHSTSDAPADEAQMDTALMSVLRDIDKALREDEGLPRIDNAPQHAAMAAALQTLDVALERAKINPNRIVLNEHKQKFQNGLTAESWDSGDVELPNGSHASLAVLWAKKLNGLVNVSITGNCGCHPNYAGERVGEWVVVLNGKSTLDSGFDIQSQADVNFWLGKLNTYNVDATACGEQVSSGGEHSIDLKLARALTLKAITTDRKRKALAEAAIAAKKSASEDKKASSPEAKPQPNKLAVILPPAEPAHVEHKPASQPILDQVHLPSASARMLLPKRAIAGEFITVSVVDGAGKPERFVELNFNESKVTTNAEGQVKFQVPEDSSPGPTLNISLAGRSEANPEQVYVLQPLIRPSAADIPRIDRYNFDANENTIRLEGHNFDGVAENNRVVLDARDDATVRFSSPVEIEARFRSLSDGKHEIVVQRNGVRSEPISWSVVHQELITTKGKKKNPS